MGQGVAGSHEMKFYFGASSPQDLQTLKECGVKNVATVYEAMYRFKGGLGKHRNQFESVMVIGGKADVVDYCELLKREMGNIDVAIQPDPRWHCTPADMMHKMYGCGVHWAMPVVLGNWDLEMAQILRERSHLQWVALAGSGRKYYRDESDLMKSIPRDCKYHRIGRGSVEAIRRGDVDSMNSSWWSYAARSGESVAWIKGEAHPIKVGRKAREDQQSMHYAISMLRDEMEACGMNISSFIAGERRDVSKVTIAAMYRPLLRQLGTFADNFI